MTGGSEKFMEKKKDDAFYFGKFKNLVCMAHKRERGRVALSEVSATLRAQNKQYVCARHRLNYLRPNIYFPLTL